MMCQILPASAHQTPATYEYEGVNYSYEYVVFAPASNEHDRYSGLLASSQPQGSSISTGSNGVV